MIVFTRSNSKQYILSTAWSHRLEDVASRMEENAADHDKSSVMMEPRDLLTFPTEPEGPQSERRSSSKARAARPASHCLALVLLLSKNPSQITTLLTHQIGILGIQVAH